MPQLLTSPYDLFLDLSSFFESLENAGRWSIVGTDHAIYMSWPGKLSLHSFKPMRQATMSYASCIIDRCRPMWCFTKCEWGNWERNIFIAGHVICHIKPYVGKSKGGFRSTGWVMVIEKQGIPQTQVKPVLGRVYVTPCAVSQTLLAL